MNVLDSRVLVLSKAWQPIDTTNLEKAITKLTSDRAKIVDTDYSIYTFEEWVDAKRFCQDMQRIYISSVNFSIPIPEVIIATEYTGYRKRRTKLSRNGIYNRDKGTCQYCGTTQGEMNLDHVVPRSTGGVSSWTNLVLSCLPCNSKKGNLTPAEVGMKLLREPKEPHWSLISRKRNHGNNLPKSWETFLGDLYWDTELEE
jgi:5-methylcytosine-specific restriction endonuclease McrA